MVNWQNILLELRKNGIFMTTIADRLNMHHKTLQRAARQGIDDLPYSKGVKLLELHQRYCK